MRPFFYEDVPAEDRPYCPPLRHDDDPEPFFRGGGQPYFLTEDGQVVDANGKPMFFFQHLADKTRAPFSDPMDAAVALMLDDGAFYMCHAYISFDWRAYLCRQTTQS